MMVASVQSQFEISILISKSTVGMNYFSQVTRTNRLLTKIGWKQNGSKWNSYELFNPWNAGIQNGLLEKVSCIILKHVSLAMFNPFSAETAFMLMQTGWIQASHRVTQRLA